MQTLKANAPWRSSKKVVEEVMDESDYAISREVLLMARTLMQANRSQPRQQYGLCAMSSSIVQSALEESPVCGAPPGLPEPERLDSDVSTVTSDHDSQLQDDTASDEEEAEIMPPLPLEEYQVLLQNLPKALLKESMLRVMIKEAKIQDIKKLAFRSDGRALITLTSYAALQQCIDHFNGLPWFHAPTCNVPSITATHVLSAKRDIATQPAASNLSADAPAFVPGASLSADAPVFVPGAMHFTLLPILEVPTEKKLGGHRRCSSRASTHSGSSSDEASCSSDSEMETRFVCA